MTLEIVPVSSLYSHEEVLEPSANKLILEFKNLASLQNPIIVDENHVVLDGNHRAYAFKVLKFKYIPVCKIDYFNQRTKLRYWFRLLSNLEQEIVRSIITSLGGTLQALPDRSALEKALEENCFACGLQSGDGYDLIEFPDNDACDAVDAYNRIQEIQDRLAARGAALSYIPCKAVKEDTFPAQLKSDQMVLWTPRITKQMVVDCAKLKKVFAPKTTRHVIPVRPLNVNMPGQWFRENWTLEEINRNFYTFLKGKRMKRFSPGMVLDGRYYEEELIVFYR
ncbi:MAG: hypothetical protein ABFS43_20340 [Thermodesulfobacteriota bacterium]